MKTFPMFLTMSGRDVVIAGGGEQAAQKARLILKTEARIRLVAETLDPELEGIVASGRAVHDSAAPTAETFRNAALVFIATGDEHRDGELHALARMAGALVNVVDRPELCDAITPSIVDRDPLVIAIGSEGAAPVLARQIKTRLETLLEPNLGGLVALAGRLRGAAAEKVEAGKRRGFWKWVFEGPVRQAHARGQERDAANLLKQAIAAGGAPDQDTGGHIALVGAGPGASDLLTLRAVQRLQDADIIFYDRLVDPSVLELARRDAERVFVGKSVGANEWPQERINSLIVAHARQGKRVVRLKSGDPAIFGRAEEEMAAARDAGVRIEIVPGVTAASAASASLGRALTERGSTERVILATGTCRPGDPAADMRALATPGTTLALYMATRQARFVRDALLEEGIPADATVDAVMHASLPGERHVATTLGAMVEAFAEGGIANPAVILIRIPKDIGAEQTARIVHLPECVSA
ncbi:MAG: uroporphyrinogen-III C-methyltransferase [Hyphomicrobiaceae bacterium]|nr:uroporphyrinogen-III C-methyltransferase [Hyphomicrobiaceae bacterium]